MILLTLRVRIYNRSGDQKSSEISDFRGFFVAVFNFDPLSDPLTDERKRTVWKHWTPPYIAISMKFPIFSAACSCIRSVTWV